MRLWLSRQADGRYMLTATKPVQAEVKGTGTADLYIRYGDPIGLRHLCAAGSVSLFGVSLMPLESVKVEINASIQN